MGDTPDNVRVAVRAEAVTKSIIECAKKEDRNAAAISGLDAPSALVEQLHSKERPRCPTGGALPSRAAQPFFFAAGFLAGAFFAAAFFAGAFFAAALAILFLPRSEC